LRLSSIGSVATACELEPLADDDITSMSRLCVCLFDLIISIDPL